MVCAQDDRKLKTIALLVDTLGYNQLMLSKSAAEQLAEKTELAKHLEEREKTLQEENEEQVRKLQEQNKLASERERKLQEQMEEQARKLQEQMEEQARKLQEHTEQNRRLQEQLVAATEASEQQCQLVKALQLELDTTKSEADADGPVNDAELVRRLNA